MPSYIGYRPQFNPVGLQEYLAVPTMIQQEFDTYEDKYNENLDKLAVLEGMTDESTRYLTDRYRDKLSNAADIITGKSGNLSDLRSQISNTRQYYREIAPKLTNAYNKRQAALKAQQDILLKDPSAVTTKVGNMQSFMDNPDQVFHSLSGDKIYADMVNAGKLSAADLNSVGKSGIAGYLAKMTGYTPQQQQEYAMLVQQALAGNKDADNALRNNPIYIQPYQVLSKYIEDNKFGVFDDSERAYVLNRALSGQLMGMTGHTDYMADKQWEHNSRMSAARTSQTPQVKEENNSVRRLPAKTNPIESSNETIKKYARFKELLEEIKRHPSILTAEMPKRTVAQMVQYATEGNYTNAELRDAQRREKQYKTRLEFEKLRDEIKKDYPDLDYNFNVTVNTNQWGIDTPTLYYDSRLDNIIADLAERTAGYTFNATDAAYKQIMEAIPLYANIKGSNDKNAYIKDDKGKPIKNEKLRDIDFNEADIVFDDNELQLRYDGKTYILEPGIFGYNDKAKRAELDRLWDSGQFDKYNEYMYIYLEDIADDARSKIKGQSSTDSKIN